VGDGADIGGSVVARHQAVLAADAILRDLGRGVPSGISAKAGRALARAKRFQHALWSLFAAPPFAVAEIADDTIVCRCESVCAGTIRAALAGHGPDIGVAKRLTRIGMGRCQGRNCSSVL